METGSNISSGAALLGYIHSGIVTVAAGLAWDAFPHGFSDTPSWIQISPKTLDGVDAFVVAGNTDFQINLTVIQPVDCLFYWTAGK